jgi:uncharacterized repeat protein (TIGR01451 family)
LFSRYAGTTFLAAGACLLLSGPAPAAVDSRGQAGQAPNRAIVGTLAARFDDSLRGGGVVCQGASFAGREDLAANTSAAITIAGIPAGATVQRALLYWMISGGSDTTATINAAAVNGVQVATAGNTCWGPSNSPTFRADVTPQVTGNGVYTIAGLPSSTVANGADTNGVALVVVYQNPASGNVRRVMIRDGAISTDVVGEVVVDTFTGVAAPLASAAQFHLVVGDGQAFPDGNVVFNGVTLASNQWNGSDGSLWDVRSYNVTVPAALANATWSSGTDQDCLEYETAVLDFNVAVCGDGLITSIEQCDQGNTTNGDGCSSVCTVEPGWQCSGQPSVCVRVVDLAVTKTDNQATAVPGLPLTYTITASNAGPSAITGATVGDTFPPALLGATWTCTASAGSLCPASGVGDINALVNLLVGGTATFSATGTVSPSATGTLTNTATVAVPAGAIDPVAANNSGTDIDTLTVQGDLGITKTNGQPTYFPGQAVTYTIVASNAGPSTVANANVTDNFPAELTSVTWTCAASAGSSCGTAGGNGNINATVTLLPAGTATFTANATVAMTATGPITNAASIAAPGGVLDPNTANNNATDTDTFAAVSDLGVTKSDGQVNYFPGQVLTYVIVAANAGPQFVTAATVTDTFPPELTGVTWTCSASAGSSCGNASGNGNINEVVNLLPSGTATFTATATVSATATGTLANTAAVAVPAGWSDPVAANDSATDSNAPIAGAAPEALAVDTAGNRVYQPNETVEVAPTWRNAAAVAMTLTGALANHTGPAGPTYTIPDGAASYGTIAAGATSSCTTTGDCYRVANATATRPATHWDTTAVETLTPTSATKTWTLHVGNSFADVPASNAFFRFIEILLHRPVTGGCTQTTYCPANSTTREQMSVFVLLSKEAPGYVPPACVAGSTVFTDVPSTSPFCRWIEELSRRGVVSGCGGGNYCPQSPVTREQMSIFVLRTLDATLTPPPCAPPNLYNDVPETSPFCRWIEELTNRSVVSGCGGGNYCPTQAVTREQMGVFLAVTFGLTLYGL